MQRAALSRYRIAALCFVGAALLGLLAPNTWTIWSLRAIFLFFGGVVFVRELQRRRRV